MGIGAGNLFPYIPKAKYRTIFDSNMNFRSNVLEKFLKKYANNDQQQVDDELQFSTEFSKKERKLLKE